MDDLTEKRKSGMIFCGKGLRKEEPYLLKLMICDDESVICESIQRMLERFSEECGIGLDIKICRSGEELLEQMTPDFDILFLDIRMGKISGMDAARKIREKYSDVCMIFVTTMTQYALEGYKVHAFGFLKKPLTYAQLRLQMLDAVHMLKSRRSESIMVKSGNDSWRLDLNKLYYMEIYGHDIHAVCADQTLTCYGSLSEYEKLLEEKGFCRCHKSYLVNLRYIRQIGATQIFMTDGSVIPVSKYRKKELSEAFARCIGGNI
ncbi:DNA-binding response regulator [Clostridium sp. AF32-12BH]|nr:DNA-binding response regulator [Clostridium sp. AF32-12BH]